MVGITGVFLIVSHCGDSVLAFPRDYLRLIEGLGAVTSSIIKREDDALGNWGVVHIPIGLIGSSTYPIKRQSPFGAIGAHSLSGRRLVHDP